MGRDLQEPPGTQAISDGCRSVRDKLSSMLDRELNSLGAALAAIGALAIVIGGGLAWGGVLGAWRYGEGLGRRWYRVFVFWRRWGGVVALAGVALVAVALVVG